MAACRRGSFLTYHSQLALFRQGQLTIESSENDSDKVLITYNQVESNQFEFPHVDSNCIWLLKPLYFIVIII